MSRKWSRNERLTAWGIGIGAALALAATVVAVTVPEVRIWLHLDKRPSATSVSVGVSPIIGPGQKSRTDAALKTSELPAASSQRPNVSLLRAEGKVGAFSAGHTTIKGQPKAGTSVAVIDVPVGGQVGTIKTGDTNIEFTPATPIPAPPNDLPPNPLSYKIRVQKLAERMGAWLMQKDSEQPPDARSDASDSEKHDAHVRIQNFWAAATPDYKRQFASDISLLASQLRKCDYIHNQARDIRWRLGFSAQSHGAVNSTLQDLRIMLDFLPDRDSLLPCADGK
jgi:hypothetical protein